MVKKESEKESSEAAKKKEALKTLTTSLKDARKEASMLVKKEKKQIADIKEHTGFKQGKQKKFEKRLREEGTFTEAKPLLQGPLPKNKYTYQVEGLIKAFLNKEKVDIRWGDNNQIIVKIGDKPEFNLTEAMKYANFNHIELTSDDYKKYVAFLQDKGPKGSRVKPENRAGGFPDEKFFEEQEKKQKKKSKGGISSALDYAEKCAINIYTKQDNLKDGKAYYALMNEFLRGNTDYLRANYTSSRALTDQCTELLAHLAMCISGTNKLPDEPLPETAWREVPEMPDFVTQENVAAAQSGSITTVMQMTSTNRDKPKDFGLAAGGNYIMYRNLKGVDVSPYSKFQGGAEREILMPPTQIVVTHHAKYAVGQGDAHFFIAQPVTTYENMAQQALQMPPQSELPADVPPLPPLRSKTAPAPVMPQPTVVQPKVKSQKIKQERAASVSAMGGIYDLSPLADALLHANKEHLSQPYTEKDVYRHDFELNTAKGRVVRPNHNIVHTIRKTSFLPHIVSYLQAYGKKNPNPYRDITEQEMRKLQAVLIFSVTGRKSDASHGDNAKKYEEYKQLSAQNFRDYFMPDGKGLFAPEEIEAYASMVQFLGSPKPSKPAPAGSYAHLYQVLNLAHNMDLQRCKNPSEYNKVFVKPMSTLVGESHAKELKTHAAQALAATGNKIVGGHYEEALFYQCSNDVQFCVQQLEKMASPLTKLAGTKSAQQPTTSTPNLPQTAQKTDNSAQQEVAKQRAAREAKEIAARATRSKTEGALSEKAAREAKEQQKPPQRPAKWKDAQGAENNRQRQQIQIGQRKVTSNQSPQPSSVKVTVGLKDLNPQQVEQFNKLLNQFGHHQQDIAKNLMVAYQVEKLKVKGKGFLHRFKAPMRDIAFKRDDQINQLAKTIDELQNNQQLNSHEKAMLLSGALQSVIDNITRTEANSPYKSGLMKLCKKLEAQLKREDIGLQANMSEAKIYYNIYRSANEGERVKAFKDAVQSSKKAQLKK